MKAISKKEATGQGFTSITHSYGESDSEREMLEDAIKQLGNKEYRVVQVGEMGRLELWRLASEIKAIYKDN